MTKCNTTKENLRLLKANSNLSYLNLTATVVDYSVIMALSTLKNLRTLILDGCVSIDDRTVQKICEHFTGLETLSLNGCHRVTDDGVEHLYKLSNLRKLSLNRLNRITGYSLENGLGSPLLHALGCEDMTNLRDFGLERIADHHPYLQKLDLSGCSKVYACIYPFISNMSLIELR